MSGIAGVWRIDGRPVHASELEQMADAIRHRGPDGTALWIRGPVGLGHTSFRTTPENKHDRQPLWLVDQQIGIVCDARLDNRDELLNLLAIDRPTDEVPDSEIILQAYVKWGEQCPERLAGDFSFAVWDDRARRLLCARDRLGVRPLFYCHVPGRLFAFASEIRSLLAVPGIPKRLNEWIIAELFEPMLEGFDKSATFYQDINRLEPACIVTMGKSSLSKREYWTLCPSREIRFPKDSYYVEAYRDIFQEAVRCRTRGLDHVGVLLSGGIDSNSVLATAERVAQQTGQSVHSLSAVAENGCPERSYMEATLRNVPVTAHFVHSGQVGDFISDFDAAVQNADEPVEPTRHYTNRILWRVAREAGIRVILSGVDGDMATTPGYGTAYLLSRGRWIRAVRDCSLAAEQNGVSTWSFLLSDGLRPLAPHLIVRAWDWWKQRVNSPGAIFLNEQYRRRIQLTERLASIEAQFPATAHPQVSQARFAMCGILAFAYEQQDVSGTRIGVEPRHPFSDHRLMEFCLAVPREQLVRDGHVKALLRRSADGRIPDEVRWRATRPTVGPWFMRELYRFRRALIENVVEHRDSLSRYLDPVQVEKVYQRHKKTQTGADLYLLLSAAYLLEWLRRTCLTG